MARRIFEMAQANGNRQVQRSNRRGTYIRCALLGIAGLAFLTGCEINDRLTAQEMRIAIDECNRHELRSVLLSDVNGNQRIECRPYDEG